MTRSTSLAATLAIGTALLLAVPLRGTAVDVLRPTFGLAADVVSRFSGDTIFAAASTGHYVILDRRAHAAYVVDAAGRNPRQILSPGWEPGKLLQPTALAFGSDDIVAVLDSPNGFDRVQYFSLTGMRLGGFYLPLRTNTRLTIEDVLVDSAGSLGFTGRTFLVNQPEWGALFAEFDNGGRVLRQVGLPRVTAHAGDRDVDLAMNIGIPVVDPTGGFFFVFRTGVPVFRKYDDGGRLMFERHIEGPELDARLLTLPTTWATRPPGARPVISPLVRAAAADRHGRLWISLTVPYTYVYDPAGEKVRTVQFKTDGVVSPSSLFFTSTGRLLIGPGGYEFPTD